MLTRTEGLRHAQSPEVSVDVRVKAMHRRVVCLAVALLVSGCSFSGLGPPPNYGYLVITAGGVGLRSGSADVPSNLDLRLHATGAALQASDVTATLDGNQLALASQDQDLLATVKPLPLSSSHRLSVAVSGLSTQNISFTVIAPTAAMLAADVDPVSGLVVDAVFDDAPEQAAVAAALPGATVTWSDGTHARVTWGGKPPASITLPASIPTAGDAHLDPGLTLSLVSIPRHTIWRVTVPAAPKVAGIPVDAFVINTAASNSSLALHLGAVAEVTPTGWQAQANGSILGTPDQSAAGRAASAGLPIWPSLSNDSTNPPATDQLLTNPNATKTLVDEMVAAIRFDGYRGINVDFEGMLAADKAPFTAFVQQLATAVHAHGAKLIVDVVPHDFAGVNPYSAAYDIAAIGKVADYVDLMAYDEHGNGGTPGPVAGLDWDNAVLQATLPDLDPAHVLLGVPLYGRAWGGSLGGASAYSNVLYNALSVPGARVDYDFSAQTPYIVSPDGSLTTYFDDADSLARKVALVHTYGLAGIAAWRLGFEDPGFWSLFSA
jgi:spore germination protein YaaH